MDNERLNILKLLIENKEKKYSIRKISKIRKINYKSAYNAIQRLKEESIINLEKIGNTSLCSFNNSFNESVFLVEYQRKKDILKNITLKILYKRISEIKNSNYILLIFGSYSKRNFTKTSDIDLCLITENKKTKDNFKQTISIFNKEIHLLTFTSEEFQSMIDITKNNVGKEILNNNIILKGIENFYDLIQNA